MKIKIYLFLLLLSLVSPIDSFSQIDSLRTKETFDNPFTNDNGNRFLSRAAIFLLREGALVFRLKTNDKSIEMYRTHGKKELAERIFSETLIRNQSIIYALKGEFKYCKVYFIYARDTKKFLSGQTNVFLNDSLEVDTSIQFNAKFVVIGEYGTAMSNLREDEYHYNAVNRTGESNTPNSTSAFVATDLNLIQPPKPFPYYDVVYLNNFRKAAEDWNAAFEKTYTVTRIHYDRYFKISYDDLLSHWWEWKELNRFKYPPQKIIYSGKKYE